MRFIILFCLLSQVHSEWVEIAQNNYRRNSFKKVPIKAEYTTESFKIYPNLTLDTPDWHKGQVNRIANVGHVRRVPYATSKTPALKIHSDHPAPPPNHDLSESIETIADGMTNKQEYYDIDIPDLRQATKLDTKNFKSNRQNKPEVIGNGHTTIDMDDEVNYSNKNEWIYVSTKPTLIKDQVQIGNSHKSNIKFNSDNGVNFNHFKTKPSNNSTLVVNLKKSTDTNEHQSHQTKLDNAYEPSKYKRNKYNNNPFVSSSIENDIKLKTQDSSNRDISDDHLNLNKIVQNLIKTLKDPNAESLNTSITDASKTRDLEIKNTLLKIDKSEESLNNQKSEIPKLKLEPSKENNLNSIWRVLKIITDIISKNTQRSVKSKIKYLENLKTNILYTIEDRINRVWPDDQNLQAQEHSRAARSAHARGHVELPSSEGALITISFLTFAVFLIKLVLQIIHTYKNKTMMMTPAVVTAVGRAAAALRTKK